MYFVSTAFPSVAWQQTVDRVLQILEDIRCCCSVCWSSIQVIFSQLFFLYFFWRPSVKQIALCYRTVVCPVSLPVCNVSVLWPNGWMDQDETWRGGRLWCWPHCVRWGPSSPQKGTAPSFWPMSVGMGMYCEKKTLIGWRDVWNMRWRTPDKEVDQRGHGERLCKKIAKHVIWTTRMLWIVVDVRSW